MSDLEELQSRFESLEVACLSLTTTVHALNETLIIVADLQRGQREQALRQEKTEVALATARDVAAARYARTRTVTRWIALGMSVLIPIVSVIVYVSLLVYVQDLLRSSNKDRYANCQLRNGTTEALVRREEALGRLEEDLARKAVHISTASELEQTKIDCSVYKDDVTK
jgi:uncharacterized membrane protein